MKKLPVFLFAVMLLFMPALPAQNNQQTSSLSSVNVSSRNGYYIFYYKDVKPDDVPQEIYDALWEIQLEVIDNFTYDYVVARDSRRYRYMTTKEEFYEYGRGVCDNYVSFFILLARENNLTENLYKVSGNRRSGSGHAWLEYRTVNNVYIIDPTWSDDYFISDAQARQRFKESQAYGRRAFFITYAEDSIIYPVRDGDNHSSYTIGKTEIPLWNR